MTSRERVRCALNHQQPDRVPIDFGGIVTSFTYGAYNRFVRHFRIRQPKARIGDFKVMSTPTRKILEMLQADFRNVYFSPTGASWNTRVDNDGTMVDVWGIRYCDVGDYYEMKELPLRNATVEDLESYSWPDFLGRARLRRPPGKGPAASRAYPLRARRHIGREHSRTFQWLRGIGDFLVDMLVNEEFAVALLDKMMELLKQFLDHYLAAVGDFIDVFCMGDDLASQGELLMSPELYRRLIKPRHAEAYAYIKERTKGEDLPSLLRRRLSADRRPHRNWSGHPEPCPAQGEGNGKGEVEKGIWRSSLLLGGRGYTAHAAPRTPEEIRNEVLATVQTLGRSGGLVLGPAHKRAIRRGSGKPPHHGESSDRDGAK